MSTTGQRIFDTTGAPVREDLTHHPLLIFETVDGHNHWHLRAAMRYALYNEVRSAEVAPAQKVGFCLLDSERVESARSSPVYLLGTFCEKNNPTAASVSMGISAGWRDRYGSTLAFQWVDVSDVPPGTYWLGATSDPDNAVLESNEGNNGTAFADSASVIPGFVAQPVSVTSIVPAQTNQVSLNATSFGSVSLANRTFEIVTAPSHGTLDKPVGTRFANTTVAYTPAAGYAGPDSFTYVAADATSEFPDAQAPATVTLSTSTAVASVAISGAPSHLVAGTSIQLVATVVADPPTLQWRVDGVAGGTATSGVISSSGLYTAPATPPAGGTVTITASSAHASSQVTVLIDPKPVPQPAPDPTPAPTPAPTPTPAPAPAPSASTQGTSTPTITTTTTQPSLEPLLVPVAAPAVRKALLAAPVLTRRGNLLVIGELPGRAGTLEVSAWKGSSRLGRCTVRTAAGRPLTCRLRIHRGLSVTGIRVVAKLFVRGKHVATRQATFSRQLAVYRGTGLECWLSVPLRRSAG
jgi:hypothetical protein